MVGNSNPGGDGVVLANLPPNAYWSRQPLRAIDWRRYLRLAHALRYSCRPPCEPLLRVRGQFRSTSSGVRTPKNRAGVGENGGTGWGTCRAAGAEMGAEPRSGIFLSLPADLTKACTCTAENVSTDEDKWRIMPPKGLPEAAMRTGHGFQRLNAYATGILISGVTFCTTDLLQEAGQNFGLWD